MKINITETQTEKERLIMIERTNFELSKRRPVTFITPLCTFTIGNVSDLAEAVIAKEKKEETITDVEYTNSNLVVTSAIRKSIPTQPYERKVLDILSILTEELMEHKNRIWFGEDIWVERVMPTTLIRVTLAYKKLYKITTFTKIGTYDILNDDKTVNKTALAKAINNAYRDFMRRFITDVSFKAFYKKE